MNCSSKANGTYGEIREINKWFYATIAIHVMLVYITMTQIYIFISKKQYTLDIGRISDVLMVDNLPFFMNISLIMSGVMGISLLSVKLSFNMALCNPYSTVAVILYGAFLLAAYMTLWLRQTMFHTEPTLKHLSTKGQRIFSYFQGCFIPLTAFIFGFIAVVVSFPNREGTRKWILASLLFLQIETQFALLALFLIPMIKHIRNSGDLLQHRDTPTVLIQVMKRSIVVTVIGICADATAFGVSYVTKNNSVFNLNVLLNSVALLFCFSNWEERLLPCIALYTNKHSTADESETS